MVFLDIFCITLNIQVCECVCFHVCGDMCIFGICFSYLFITWENLSSTIVIEMKRETYIVQLKTIMNRKEVPIVTVFRA